MMLRSMMEGLAFISGDNVVVVDVPGPLVHPADIDLGKSLFLFGYAFVPVSCSFFLFSFFLSSLGCFVSLPFC